MYFKYVKYSSPLHLLFSWDKVWLWRLHWLWRLSHSALAAWVWPLLFFVGGQGLMDPRPISKATSLEFLTRCLRLHRVTGCTTVHEPALDTLIFIFTKEQTVPYILSLAQNLMLKFVNLMSQYCQEMEEPSSHQSPQCVLWAVSTMPSTKVVLPGLRARWADRAGQRHSQHFLRLWSNLQSGRLLCGHLLFLLFTLT